MSNQVLVFSILDYNPDTHISFQGRRLVNRPGAIHSWVKSISGKLFYTERGPAETNPSVKQVIPYTIVENEQGKVLSYLRGGKGGEKRLHAKRSIGFGGHIGPEDNGDPLVAMLRELEEELKMPQKFIYDVSPSALLYDPSNEVGQVHFGLVYYVTVETDMIEGNEEVDDVSFESVSELKSGVANFENWSQIIINSWEEKC